MGFIDNDDFRVNFLIVFGEGPLKHKVLGSPLWKTIRKLIRRRFPFNLHKDLLKHKAGGGLGKSPSGGFRKCVFLYFLVFLLFLAFPLVL